LGATDNTVLVELEATRALDAVDAAQYLKLLEGNWTFALLVV
jgi:hypothetical protein